MQREVPIYLLGSEKRRGSKKCPGVMRRKGECAGGSNISSPGVIAGRRRKGSSNIAQEGFALVRWTSKNRGKRGLDE